MRIRHFMKLDLAHRPAHPAAHLTRRVRPSDRDALAHLMLAAYRGSADDEGETIAEARQEVDSVFDDADRPFLEAASFVVDLDGVLASASLVSLFRGVPLVVHLMTHPRHKRAGLGTSALLRSAEALVEADWRSLTLYVTDANRPALTLYRKLGFEIIPAADPPTAAPPVS